MKSKVTVIPEKKGRVPILLGREGGWWVVTRVDRDCASQGRTPVEALRNFAEAWEIRYGRRVG